MNESVFFPKHFESVHIFLYIGQSGQIQDDVTLISSHIFFGCIDVSQNTVLNVIYINHQQILPK